jgi:hypothetical protein
MTQDAVADAVAAAIDPDDPDAAGKAALLAALLLGPGAAAHAEGGACKPGERADLTGCTPTKGSPGVPAGHAPARVEAHPTARAAAAKLLGKEPSDTDLSAMACAPPGATVSVGVSGGKLYLTAEKRAPDGGLEFNSTREVYKPWFAPLTCKNITFGLRGEGRGQGLALFDGQVRALQGAGVKRVVTSAAGSPQGGGNGYYTWPRMGYGGTMTSQQVERLPDDIKKALGGKRDVRDVFDLPGGAEAWRKYGSSMKLTFDLTPGSRNMRALESYKAERAAKEQR